MANSLRIGIVGLGNIGQEHAKILLSGMIANSELKAVCCARLPSQLELPKDVVHFTDYRELMASGLVDAVLVATPTMTHVEIGVCACQHGLHLLMEKPVAMSVQQITELKLAQQPDQMIGVMLNQRYHPHYAEVKKLLAQNRLGELRRLAWTMTAWYRPDIYYQVSTWRGT